MYMALERPFQLAEDLAQDQFLIFLLDQVPPQPAVQSPVQG